MGNKPTRQMTISEQWPIVGDGKRKVSDAEIAFAGFCFLLLLLGGIGTIFIISTLLGNLVRLFFFPESMSTWLRMAILGLPVLAGLVAVSYFIGRLIRPKVPDGHIK